MSAYRFSPLRQISPDVGVDSRDRLRDRDGLQAGQDVLDERSSARASGSVRAQHPVQEL